MFAAIYSHEDTDETIVGVGPSQELADTAAELAAEAHGYDLAGEKWLYDVATIVGTDH